MSRLTGGRATIGRKLRELGSLVTVTAIVLGVCGITIVSAAGAETRLPSRFASVFTRQRPMEYLPQAHVSASGLKVPVAYRASVEVVGWQKGSHRLLDVSVLEATPIDSSGRVAESSKAAWPAFQMAASLKGRKVLASVTKDVAAAMPSSGHATVRLVALPQGETAGLVIDQVFEPVSSARVAAVFASPAAHGAPGVQAAVAKPRIDRLSTYYGKPGTPVTAYGGGFGPSQGASVLSCAGAPAQVISWSDTQVTFTVPAAAGRTGYVGVVMGPVTSNGLYFVPADRPVVTSIAPREGAPGTVVTINGVGFGSAQRDGWVSFAGSAAEVVSWTDTRIRVVVPRGARAGYAGVVANGLASNGVLYGPYGLPFATSISSSRVSRGEVVVIRGRDFGTKPGLVVLGPARLTASSWSPNRIEFTVPKGVRSGYLGVLRDDSAASNGTWTNLVPRMTGLSGWWASPGDEIVLSGVGFEDAQGDYEVYVGRVQARVIAWSDGAVRAIVPAGAPSGYVGVGTDAACSNGIPLVVETRARISAVSPRRATPGATVVITGSGFGSPRASSSVRLGGSGDLSVVSWTDTSITVVVPTGATAGYLGVVKQNVTSNGVWLDVAP